MLVLKLQCECSFQISVCNDTNHGVVDIYLLLELLSVFICAFSSNGEGPRLGNS